MRKCILFSRVSTFKQDLEQQTNELVKEAHNLGYDDEHIIAIEQKESAIKLSIYERKGIQQLKQQIESDSEIDCIIVYEISRLSRQSAMLFELRDYLISHSIQLICLKPYMRLLEDGKMSQTASILFSLFSSLSESEMMIKKERMLRGRYVKREQNKFIGGGILFGYKINEENYITIDKEEADTVQKIFVKYSQGHSLRDIARELSSRGRLSRYSQNIFTLTTTIRNILSRIEYTGTKSFTYKYPRIISKELFDTVQPLLSRAKEKSLAKHHYLLKSLLVNSNTNNILVAHNSHYSDTPRMTVKLDKDKIVNLKMSTIDSFITERVKSYIESHRESYKESEQLKTQHDMRVCDEQIYFLTLKNQQLEKMIDRVERRIIEGKLSDIKGDQYILEYRQEIEQNIVQIESINKKLYKLANKIHTNIYDIDFDSLDEAKKNETIKEIISIIEVMKLPNGEYVNSRGKSKNTMKRVSIKIHWQDESISEYIYCMANKQCWIK